MPEQKDFTFTLTVDEANEVLVALGNQPFIRVAELIGKIQSQAQGQGQPDTEDVDG